jgi:hypothetical protein
MTACLYKKLKKTAKALSSNFRVGKFLQRVWTYILIIRENLLLKKCTRKNSIEAGRFILRKQKML